MSVVNQDHKPIDDDYEEDEECETYTIDYTKVIQSVIAGAICAIMLIMTNGQHGIGWFLCALFLIN